MYPDGFVSMMFTMIFGTYYDGFIAMIYTVILKHTMMGLTLWYTLWYLVHTMMGLVKLLPSPTCHRHTSPSVSLTQHCKQQYQLLDVHITEKHVVLYRLQNKWMVTLLPWALNNTFVTLGKAPGCLSIASGWMCPHSYSRTLPSALPVRSVDNMRGISISSQQWKSEYDSIKALYYTESNYRAKKIIVSIKLFWQRSLKIKIQFSKCTSIIGTYTKTC